MTLNRAVPGAQLTLEYPKSVGVYDDYLRAQSVVDYLSDQQFPVQNIALVGTDLKSVERVTGRLTRAKAATAGAVSGLWIGLFVGIAFSLFSNHGRLGFLLTTPLLGAVFMLVLSQVGFNAATRGGTRDFSSISQIVATKYEVLIEHRFVEQARALLATMPAARS